MCLTLSGKDLMLKVTDVMKTAAARPLLSDVRYGQVAELLCVCVLWVWSPWLQTLLRAGPPPLFFSYFSTPHFHLHTWTVLVV
jgi:hypothetical protein